MRHRWSRSAPLRPMLLAAVLVVSLVPAAAAQPLRQGSPRVSLTPQAHWFDQTANKALRATQQPQRWEVLIDLGTEGEWRQQGFLQEVYRHRPNLPAALDGDLKETLDALGTVLLIGESRASTGGRVYVVAAVLEQESSFKDADGVTLRPFVPVHLFESYQDALRFAQTYEETLVRGVAGGEPAETPDLSPTVNPQIFGSNCELRCFNAYNRNLAACATSEQSCRLNADIFRGICNTSCAGNPACQAGCALAYVGAIGICALDRVACENTAETLLVICSNNCPEGGGCSAIARETETTALSLGGRAGRDEKLAVAAVDFALSRAEFRGEESFVMDEWAIVEDGRVRRSSNPTFAQAVAQRPAAKAGGPFLLIQEPVHDMNSRHVPKPQVRISGKALSALERGTGQIVAARLELSPSKVVDRVEVVYTSEPMEAGRLETLVRDRVGLEFASERGHRTAVYVVFRLTDRVDVLGTATAFPKCCCGGEFCV